jgi:hypothetical protein
MKLLKPLLVAGVCVTLVAMTPSPLKAETYDCENSDHPARYVVYPIHALGKGIETFVTRPIHWLVSRPKFRHVFGHVSNPKSDDYSGDFDLYQRYAY